MRIVKPRNQVLIKPEIEHIPTYGLGWNKHIDPQTVREGTKYLWSGAKPAAWIKGNVASHPLTDRFQKRPTVNTTQGRKKLRSSPVRNNRAVSGLGVRNPNSYTFGLSDEWCWK